MIKFENSVIFYHHFWVTDHGCSVQKDQNIRIAQLEGQGSKNTSMVQADVQKDINALRALQNDQNNRLVELEKIGSTLRVASLKLTELEGYVRAPARQNGVSTQGIEELREATVRTQRMQQDQILRMDSLAEAFQEQKGLTNQQLAQFSEALKQSQQQAAMPQPLRQEYAPKANAQNEETQQSSKFVLSNDTLFRFNGSSRDDILANGEAKLRGLAEAILNSGAKVDVVGHEDRLEAREGGKVGQKRADAVRKLLIEAGVPAENIQSYSAGSREPVISQCGTHANENAIACLQPNRRVAIHVR